VSLELSKNRKSSFITESLEGMCLANCIRKESRLLSRICWKGMCRANCVRKESHLLSWNLLERTVSLELCKKRKIVFYHGIVGKECVPRMV
jgi:hypothetical protein